MRDFAGLTDVQVRAVFGHPTDGKGELVEPRPPQEPMTLEEELATARAMLAQMGVAAEEIERGLAVIEAAHDGGG